MQFKIIAGDPEKNFYLNKRTGQLRLLKKLDYEKETTVSTFII